MVKQDFLNALRAALGSELSAAATEEHVRYYEEYISSQVRMGKSEEQVLRELGNPKLIARSIIDAESQNGSRAENSNYSNSYQSNEKVSAKKGIGIGNRMVPVWLIVVLVVVLVCVILWALVMLVWWLAPVIVAIWLIGFGIKLLRGRR